MRQPGANYQNGTAWRGPAAVERSIPERPARSLRPAGTSLGYNTSTASGPSRTQRACSELFEKDATWAWPRLQQPRLPLRDRLRSYHRTGIAPTRFNEKACSMAEGRLTALGLGTRRAAG